MENHLLIYECGSPEHQIIFTKDEEEVYISYLLSPYTLFKRLKVDIKCVFGYRSKYGDFGSVITTKQNLQEVIDKL